MNIPPFSIFSAVSELFVTAAVFYVVGRNWNRKPFPLTLFIGAALFEALVNVFYMATRASQASGGGEPLSNSMKLFFAAHGILSLIAYLVFVMLAVFAYQDQKAERWYFRERPALTWAFIILWIVSIGSGEVLFALRYLV